MVFEFNGSDVWIHQTATLREYVPKATHGIVVPGSKSLTNRFLLIAGLCSGGNVTLKNALDCEDSRAMSNALRQLGCRVAWHGLDLSVVAPKTLKAPLREPIFIQNAGTAMRFLLAACAMLDEPVVLDGNTHMRRRPQEDLIQALKVLGAQVSYFDQHGCAPIRMLGPIRAGDIQLNANISSQYLSALLMVLPLLQGDSRIELKGSLVSRTYVEMTLDCLDRCGVRIESNQDLSRFLVPGNQRVREFNVQIEPDASTASYWFALPAMVGGEIKVNHLPEKSFQGDFGLLDIFEQMGMSIKRADQSVQISSGTFSGIDVNMNSMSDVAPTLAAVATRAQSPTVIRDVGNMRVKECDRIAVLQRAFDDLGLQMESGPDWMRIVPGFKKAMRGPVLLDPHDDHRMAMAFALLGLSYGKIGVKNYSCVGKTYPGFFTDFSKVLVTRG